MLNGKVALITGGSRGIGKSVSIELAKAGAIVIINYANSESSAKEALNIVEESGGTGEILQFNVSDTIVVEEKIKYILEKYEKIDILVNNAGITRDSLFMRMKEQQWDEVFEVNTKGVFNCTKNVVRSTVSYTHLTLPTICSV